MAKIPVYAGVGAAQGPSTVAPANLQAVTNEAIGQGLQTVSKELSRVEELSRRANDVKNLTNASVSMSKAQADFADFQQKNPDESKWLEKWQETIGSLETSIGEMPLTPDARAQLTDRFSSWSTRGTISVQAEAFRQTGRNAQISVQNAIRMGERTGNFTPAREALPALRPILGGPATEALEMDIQDAEIRKQETDKDTYRAQTMDTVKALAGNGDVEGVNLVLNDPGVAKNFSPDELTILKNDWTKAAQSSFVEKVVMEEVAEDPTGAVLRLEAKTKDGAYQYYPEISQSQRNFLVSQGLRLKATDDERSTGELYEAVAGGQVRSMKDLEKEPYLSKFSKLPPSYKASIEKLLKEGNITDPAEYERAKTMIEGADLTDDLNIARMKRHIGLFAKEEQELLLQKLDGRLNSNDKTPKAVADLFQEIDADLAAGMFGEYRLTGDKVSIGDDGTVRRIVKEGFFTDDTEPLQISEQDRLNLSKADAGKKASTIVEDAQAKRKAAVKAADIKAQIERMMNEGATYEEARVKYYELTNSPRLEDARKLLNTANPALFPTPSQGALTIDQIEELLRKNGR